MEQLLAVMRKLRSPDGCPWDVEQTHESIKPCLVEETYEVLDAIDQGDMEALKEELGDVLLQVVFHAQISDEHGQFAFKDVVDVLTRKLIRRHPHVFGDVDVADSDEVLKNWNAIKKEEKDDKHASLLSNIPRSFPALLKAHQVQKKVTQVGFDWTDRVDVIAKIEEELQEVREAIEQGDAEHTQEELGDLLFSVVNLARFQGYHAEECLNRTITKFICRFQKIEDRFHAQDHALADSSLAELDAVWEAIKQDEREQRRAKDQILPFSGVLPGDQSSTP
ncbi:MAG: nucleoside triphosphate pyrophosphohydrolase [Spartobacteria bacterium]|nr:nucleoside triphosphate pyrophosphohydrolase [Spartobacteria bacterium]